MKWIDFGGVIPKEVHLFILYNTVNSGIIYGFAGIGLLGVYAGLSSKPRPKLKQMCFISMVMLWTSLAFIFAVKDIRLGNTISFSTVLVVSMTVNIYLELWVGEVV